MQIRIAGFAEESIVDGPGLRFTVFVQGCNTRCKGCHNPETWDTEGGKVMDTDDIFAMFADNPLLDGITISGGEPFLQPGACSLLAEYAHKHDMNVMVYTGFLYEDLLKSTDGEIKKFLSLIDILVDGPFMEEQKSLNLLFRGSRNQRIIYLKDGVLMGTEDSGS